MEKPVRICSKPIEITEDTVEFTVQLTEKAYRYMHFKRPDQDWGECYCCSTDSMALRYQSDDNTQLVCVNCWKDPADTHGARNHGR